MVVGKQGTWAKFTLPEKKRWAQTRVPGSSEGHLHPQVQHPWGLYWGLPAVMKSSIWPRRLHEQKVVIVEANGAGSSSTKVPISQDPKEQQQKGPHRMSMHSSDTGANNGAVLASKGIYTRFNIINPHLPWRSCLDGNSPERWHPIRQLWWEPCPNPVTMWLHDVYLSSGWMHQCSLGVLFEQRLDAPVLIGSTVPLTFSSTEYVSSPSSYNTMNLLCHLWNTGETIKY